MEFEELQKKAEQGDADAQFKLGRHYCSTKEYKTATNWLMKAATQNHERALWQLNRLYGSNRISGPEIDRWYFDLAEHGNISAQKTLYELAEANKNYKDALRWRLKAATQDYHSALHLGEFFEEGNTDYSIEPDYSAALDWYRKAAELSNYRELYRLLRLLHKLGKDEEALQWTIKGSEVSVSRCRQVGLYYENGICVKKDINEAMRWYKKAAEEGEDPWLRLFYGEKLLEQGKPQEALRWFESIDKNDVNKQEARNLAQKCRKLLKSAKKYENSKYLVEEPISTKEVDSFLQQLQSLIGLNEVKQEISTLVNLLKLQSMRKQHGLPEIPLSRHLVFVGNPGTGKTTVARLLSEIYHQLGILSKGQLIEVDRSGLVAGYVGQTALKTQEVIQSAVGGVLFIDEAYTLAKSDSSNDFGQEAIDTILKAMEDHRNDFIVIVAGYPDLMKNFINSNPGLKSRFNKYIYFQDYNPEELLDIFKLQCKNAGLILEDGASEIAFDYLQNTYEHRDSNFANGRSVRNYFERVLSNQANRLAMQSAVSETDLITLSKDDVQSAAIDGTTL